MNIMQKVIRRVQKYIYRKRLKNKDFTIISKSCWGGVVYNMLGLRFDSPFINLDCDDKDFYKVATNLKTYMSYELKFVHSIEKYPTAYLGDVLLRFVHYHSDDEARDKWNERRERIHYDNIFFLVSDRPNGDKIVTDDEIRAVAELPFRGKVVFSVRDIAGLNYLVKLDKDIEGDFVNIYMLDKTSFLKRWRWETKFDWVHFLNTGQVKK